MSEQPPKSSGMAPFTFGFVGGFASLGLAWAIDSCSVDPKVIDKSKEVEVADLRFAEDYCPAAGNRWGSLQFMQDKAMISGHELCNTLHETGEACAYSIAEWHEFKDASDAVAECECKHHCDADGGPDYFRLHQ